MNHLVHLIFIIISLIMKIKCQGGGTTTSGDTFVCVPPGYCNNYMTSPPGIDPRIVTPGQGGCPAGQVACITQGPGSNCGIRYSPQSSSDGQAAPFSYPWQVYIENATGFAGSGVLLDNYHVLTAAHKLSSVTNPQNINVFVGLYALSNTTGSQVSRGARIVIHPNYVPATLINDIAIIRVNPPFRISSTNVNTLCLPPASTSSYVGQRCAVSGWGQTAFSLNDAPTNPMKQVFVRVVNYTTCRTSFAAPNLLNTSVDRYLDPNGEICAGGESMKDACTQDGGSPLACPDQSGRSSVAGLVIWGKNCGQSGVYGVYVSVPYYRNWITTTITSLNAS